MLDVVRYDSVFRTSLLGPDESEPTLDRWHLDGHGGPVKEERLDDRGQEFPRVDERMVGRPTPLRLRRVVPGRARSPPATVRSSATTSPRARPRCVAWGATSRRARRSSCPRADEAAEDDGWLLALVYSKESDSSALHILDTADLTGDPQAVVELPQRVPVGFHGNWVPDLA